MTPESPEFIPAFRQEAVSLVEEFRDHFESTQDVGSSSGWKLQQTKHGEEGNPTNMRPLGSPCQPVKRCEMESCCF